MTPTTVQKRSWRLTSSWSALDPLSRRLLQIVGVLSALLVLLIANALIHGMGDGQSNQLNPISQAAERTLRAAGARSAIQANYSSPALTQPLVMNGRGVYNGDTGRSRTTMTMQVPPPLGSLVVEAIGDARAIYLRSPLISKRLPPGREWMGIDPWLGRTAETAFAGNADAKAQLRLLAAVNGEVEVEGEEDVRGVRTTHYRGTVDLGHYIAVLGREGRNSEAQRYERLMNLMPSRTAVEAWISDDGLLRRMRVFMSVPDAPSQSSISMDMQIDFFDFGISPNVRIPAAGEVFNVTPLVRAEQGLLTGESLGPVIQPAAGGKLLSAPDFHQRANTICAEVSSRQSHLEHRAEGPMRALKYYSQIGGTDEARREGILKAYRRAAYSYFEPALHIAERGLRRLGKLVPPGSLASTYREYLLASAVGIEATEAEVRALESGDFEVAQRLQEQIHTHSDQNNRRAKRLGLGECIEEGKRQSPGAPTATAPA